MVCNVVVVVVCIVDGDDDGGGGGDAKTCECVCIFKTIRVQWRQS